MAMEGGCQCGALRYRCHSRGGPLYACHCRECRKQSASVFGLSLILPRKDFELLSGRPQVWTRGTNSGNRLRCAFCPTCGSRVWHEAHAQSETVTIKGGCLDEVPNLAEAIHIWVSRKLDSVAIPEGATCYPEEPPN